MVIARTIHNNVNKIASKSSYFDPGEALGLGRAPGKLQKRLKSPSVEIASASWDQVSKVGKKNTIANTFKVMQNSCHFGEYEGAGTVICKYRYILGNYNQKVNSKGNGNDKKGARAHYDAGRNCEERSFRATREMFLFAGFKEKD